MPISIWYNWKNDGTDLAEREHNFGDSLTFSVGKGDGRLRGARHQFAELLGLGLKWRVTECVFHKDRSQVDLQLEPTDEVWKLERCPQCGAEARGYDRTEPLRWRHLNVMQYRCEIVARLPRGARPQVPSHLAGASAVGRQGRWLQQGV